MQFTMFTTVDLIPPFENIISNPRIQTFNTFHPLHGCQRPCLGWLVAGSRVACYLDKITQELIGYVCHWIEINYFALLLVNRPLSQYVKSSQ